MLEQGEVDDERIIQAHRHYIAGDAFTYPQLVNNLKSKLEDPDFASDLADLVIEPPSGYDMTAAADLVMERLGSHLDNAPPLDEIKGGAWRT